MQSRIEHTSRWGDVLWLESESAQVGVALEFGIRVVHISCPGCENLCYVQPADLSDGFTTKDGWQLVGGHRIWMAPESDETYYPDNDPVAYALFPDGVLLTQEPEPWLGIRKRLKITFLADGGVELYNSIENVSEKPVFGASWGVNTVDGGGIAEIRFTSQGRDGYSPHRVVSLWSDTNLHDPRLTFGRNSLTARHIPLQEYLKLGLYCLEGRAELTNKGQKMTILFDTAPLAEHPDNGCNFELYMCSQFMELETLGTNANLQPGESTGHRETWYLTKV